MLLKRIHVEDDRSNLVVELVPSTKWDHENLDLIIGHLVSLIGEDVVVRKERSLEYGG